MRSLRMLRRRFRRTFKLSKELDPSKVTAKLVRGVLTLRIPKPETMRPHRVEIKAQAHGSHEQVNTGQRESATVGA